MSVHSESVSAASPAACATVPASVVRNMTRFRADVALAICGEWVVTTVDRLTSSCCRCRNSNRCKCGCRCASGSSMARSTWATSALASRCLSRSLSSEKYRTFKAPRLVLVNCRCAEPSTNSRIDRIRRRASGGAAANVVAKPWLTPTAASVLSAMSLRSFTSGASSSRESFASCIASRTPSRPEGARFPRRGLE